MFSKEKIFSSVYLIRESFGKYRNKFLVMLVLGFLVGIFGGIGIGAIIPIFALLLEDGNGQSAATDDISQKIQQLFSFFNIEYNIVFLLIFVVVLFVLKAVLTYVAHYFNERFATDYERETGQELFRTTLKADWPYLMEQKIGHLETILVQNVYNTSSILTNISSILMTGASLTMYAAVALSISVPITLTTLGLGVAIFFALKPIFYRIRKTAHKLAVVTQHLNHHIGEHLIGAKTVKATCTEDKITEKSKQYFEDLKKSRITVALYNKATGTFLEPVGIIFISIIFVFYYRSDPLLSLASFAAIIYLVQKKITFIQTIQSKLNNINEALPQLKIVSDYRKLAQKHQETTSGDKPFIFNEEFRLDNIHFAYNDKMKVLSGLNLTIKRGEMVGLIGPSGAGKTTLVDILLRLLTLGAGEMKVDGISASEINIQDWRKKVGYVSQDIFLLNDTVENNIRFYNDQVSQVRIEEVARLANAYDFIEKLPDKFQTLVGERGVKLSAGQRQRVILARILARNPEILILDEATSALDNESEVLIQHSIESLRNKITVVAIAHRLSTVTNSDRLIVLENGRIKEEGTPAEMLKDKDSYFYKVYNIRNE